MSDNVAGCRGVALRDSAVARVSESLAMPYCTNCGTQIEAQWSFCHNCGTQQIKQAPFSPGRPPVPTEFLQGISERTASTLCYIPVFGIIPAIIFLATSRFRSNSAVRFNAFQSLYLFVAWLIISSALPSLLPGFHMIERETLKLGMVVLYVFLLIRANRGEATKVPILGDLASRSAAEQL